ncbi:nicotinate-nucleotide adenylyltransferase [bacterium]|nr:nicotinate-nucleotide adenylyltransferase [bacterium]
MDKNKIGLFGGTFNPIHSGHLKAAWIVQKRFHMSQILFIPSHIPPHKESTMVVSPAHRLQMVAQAVSSYSRFIPSAIEIEAGGKSYSIRTLEKIKTIYPERWIFFIMGSDAFMEIETWKDYQKLLQQCYFIVMTRPGYDLDEAKKVLGKEYFSTLHWLSEAEEVDESMLTSYNIFFLSIKTIDVSSTEIRQRIKNGKPIKGLVPPSVENYIMENGLYKNQNEG